MTVETKKTFLETDLYKPVHDYLIRQGYKVRSEVHNCDIAAVKDNELIIIEMKRNLGIALLAQAVERQRITDSVYVAIPRPPNKRKWMSQSKNAQLVLRRLELGLILVSTERRRPPVEIIMHPASYQRQRRKSRQRAILEEIEKRTVDMNQGGSSRRKLVTAYRENAIHIACCLDLLGPSTPKVLRSLGTGKKTLSVLSKNVYSWFQRVSRGVYGLTPGGKNELCHYTELVEHYNDVIKQHMKNRDAG